MWRVLWLVALRTVPTMKRCESRGGGQGAGGGGREFSLPGSQAKLPALTSEDSYQGGGQGSRKRTHNPPDPGSVKSPGQAPSPSVRGRKGRLEERPLHDGDHSKIGEERPAESPVVRVPDELPVLSPLVCRALLAVLVELTEVEILDVRG